MNRSRGRALVGLTVRANEAAKLSRAGGLSGEFLASVEWIRLPGLFHWKEVCDVTRQIQEDDEWCFAVRQVSLGPYSEALFVVDAGTRRRVRMN